MSQKQATPQPQRPQKEAIKTKEGIAESSDILDRIAEAQDEILYTCANRWDKWRSPSKNWGPEGTCDCTDRFGKICSTKMQYNKPIRCDKHGNPLKGAEPEEK